jgi:hypothetical protein
MTPFCLVRFGPKDWRVCCGGLCIPGLSFKSKRKALAYINSK